LTQRPPPRGKNRSAGKNVDILATYEDGLKATATACAARESMEMGQVVDLA
jgi:hypothetical protein